MRAAVVLLLSATVNATPAFISGASVERDGDHVRLTILLACQVDYVSKTPDNRATAFRIQLDSTGVCKGAPPTIAKTQEYYLPARAADAKLTSLDYDGSMFGNQILTLTFSDVVSLRVDNLSADDQLRIAIDFNAPQPLPVRGAARKSVSHRVRRSAPAMPVFVINLESSLRPPATGDMPDFELAVGHRVYVSEVQLNGRSWYRTRLGFFESKALASAQLKIVQQLYPGAWIDIADKKNLPPIPEPMTAAVLRGAAAQTAPQVASDSGKPSRPRVRAAIPREKLLALMQDGRSAMVEGRLDAAVQIYTKVLQYPEHEFMPEAQEYLALARERKGQTAHARAEYQRYLAKYPDADGADRVEQRLAALLARTKHQPTSAQSARSVPHRRGSVTRQQNPWRIQTFFSQYYRRDVNQPDASDSIVSQSSLFSDVNFDARRRGVRYDFGSRISAGYRYDTAGAGNDVRVSYAYADLADARTGLRGRIGRQSRNTGGVLGRFDGFNLGYQASERVLLNAVAGKPVNSASDGIDDSRTFYGLSANFGPIADNLDLGGFYVRQNAGSLTDREAIGAEMRYFDSNRSLWGLIDYDVSYKELGSVFLQGSWRFASQFSVNAVIDRRHSPFLTTSNALIGQPFSSLSQLAANFDEHQLRQLSLDRSAITTTYTIGASKPLTPKLQLNATATQSTVSATPESGGVSATPETVFQYYSLNLVAGSLLREGDVSIIGVRYSQSASSDVSSVNLDLRFPFTRSFYINPRLRVDYRQIHADSSTEWILTPGLRMQYRLGRTVRIELQAGRQFAFRDIAGSSLDRASYFINLGYQSFF